MRNTDTSRARFERAADRIYTVDGVWYVRTREGERGPFRNRRQAEAELHLYVDTMRYLEKFDSRVPPEINRGDVDVVNMDAPAWI